MTRPTAQVLTLLELLQSGGVRTTAELAGRLGVDERTVRRYVDHLIDLDIPVESARGRYGRYGGYRLDALLGEPFVIEQPDELRDLVGALAARLTEAASGTRG